MSKTVNHFFLIYFPYTPISSKSNPEPRPHEVLDLTDDERELLDEYLNANVRANAQKGWEEFLKFPYSVKDDVKDDVRRNLGGNGLWEKTKTT